MKNFTQKALMVVLTLFVLVGLFYGLSTPVTVSSAAGGPAVGTHDTAPLCAPETPTPDCPLIPK